MKQQHIILAVIFMLFLAGCTTTNTSGSGSGAGLSSSFNGGEAALEFIFGDNAPPESVRDNGLQPFSVRIQVQNVGEYDIPEGEGAVTLTGFNPADLGLADNSQPLQALRGFKKQGDNVVPGGRQQVIFDNLKYIPSAVSGSFPLTIYANFCFQYETKAFALVCINGDTVPTIDDSTTICELEGEKEFANSGAPVKIDNVQQFPSGQSSIQIQFDIVHTPTSDGANLFERGALDDNCRVDGNSPGSSEALFKKDKVRYIVESGIAGLNCESTGTGSNTVTLTGDIYTVTCIQDTTGQEEFPKPVTITLEYDYLDRGSVDIEIDHIDTN